MVAEAIHHVMDLQGACSDQQPHPPNFFFKRQDLVPEVDSYLEGFVCEVGRAKSVVQEKSAKTKTPLGN